MASNAPTQSAVFNLRLVSTRLYSTSATLCCNVHETLTSVVIRTALVKSTQSLAMLADYSFVYRYTCVFVDAVNRYPLPLPVIVVIKQAVAGQPPYLHPLQVDNILIFIRQVAPVPACWLLMTSATSWILTFWPWKPWQPFTWHISTVQNNSTCTVLWFYLECGPWLQAQEALRAVFKEGELPSHRSR